MYLDLYCDRECVWIASLSQFFLIVYTFSQMILGTVYKLFFGARRSQVYVAIQSPYVGVRGLCLCLHSCDNEESLEGQIERPQGPAEGIQDRGREKGKGNRRRSHSEAIHSNT